jgi:hypothetical protein
MPQVVGRSLGGEWGSLLSTSTVPVHISLLPDGRLLYWGRDKDADGWDTGSSTKTYLVDYQYLDNPNATATPSPLPTTNLFCSGHSFLPDGRLLVTGGHSRESALPKGEGSGTRSINIFDYRSNSWTRETAPGREMELGRWYPYNVTLPNGETLIMAGTYWTGRIIDNKKLETMDNRSPNVRDLQGNIRTLRDDSTFPRIDTYPYISVFPDGKVFIAKPSLAAGVFSYDSRFFDPYATNAIGEKGVFTKFASPSYRHWEGTSVMYEPGKVLLIGGSSSDVGPGQANVSTVEAMDITQANPTWTELRPLSWVRQYPTATLLPDGKVLVTGGTSCVGSNNLNCPDAAVQTPELWDPTNPTANWQRMNPTSSGHPRVYHSMALLLPDARVLVGGGGLPAAAGEVVPVAPNGSIVCAGNGSDDAEECRKFGHNNAEIFSPPYLFDQNNNPAVRPAITSAPDTIAYGQTINIGVGNISGPNISKVVLVRLPSVTHTYNQDQRRVVLKNLTASTTNPDLISVSTPADGRECPPGPYMMFLISNNGRNTPSVAKIVRVGALSLDRTSAAFAHSTDVADSVLSDSIAIKTSQNWTVTTDSSWITISSGTSGSGNGTVNFTVAQNINPDGTSSARKGKIIISTGEESGRYEFTVYQAGKFQDVDYTGQADMNLRAPLSISKIYARSVTIGCSVNPSLYCPGDSVTRLQMVTFISRVLGKQNLPMPTVQRFNDVPITDPNSKFVEFAARNGITAGCNPPYNNLFCPNQAVKRSEMAVFIMAALGVKQPPTPSTAPFFDVPVTHWAAGYIEELRRRNISGGCGNGNYCPDALVTRRDMAVFLALAFKL